MKELLMISGGIFLFLIAFTAVSILAIVIALFIFMPKYLTSFPQALELNEQAQDFVNATILEIVTDWNFNKLFEKATPQLLELTHSKEAEKIFYFCRQLGKLESYKGATGAWQSSADESKKIIKGSNENSGIITLGNYVAEAEFKKGSAIIKVQIIMRDNQWFINSFSIGTQELISTLGIPTTLEALVDTDKQKIRLEALLKADEKKE